MPKIIPTLISHILSIETMEWLDDKPDTEVERFKRYMQRSNLKLAREPQLMEEVPFISREEEVRNLAVLFPFEDYS